MDRSVESASESVGSPAQGISSSTSVDASTSATNAENLICYRCKLPLEEKVVSFNYMGYSFTKEMQVCPNCEQVFIPRELVLGTMQKVENELEDK